MKRVSAEERLTPAGLIPIRSEGEQTPDEVGAPQEVSSPRPQRPRLRWGEIKHWSSSYPVFTVTLHPA